MTCAPRLRIFIKVAEHLSFSRAAAELDMSQSSVSKAISSMEEDLGVRLINRTSRSVELTCAGQAYLPRAKCIVRLLSEAATVVRQITARP